MRRFRRPAVGIVAVLPVIDHVDGLVFRGVARDGRRLETRGFPLRRTTCSLTDVGNAEFTQALAGE